MNLYSFACYKTVVSILYLLSLLQTTDQIPSNEEATDYKHRYFDNDAIGSPYLVLMSDKSIAVAQLPMILFGNVSDVYALPSEEHSDGHVVSEIEKEGLRFVGSDDGDSNDRRVRHATSIDADVGAHLPDMSVNTTTSLGKSEWQQIANGVRVSTRSRFEQAESNDVQDAANPAPEKQDEHHLVRRPRSSNSLKDHDGSGSGISADPGDGLAATNITKEEDRASAKDLQQTQAGIALSSHMQNVTSAAASSQLESIERQQRLKFASESVGTPAEDDDKIAGSSAPLLTREQGPSLVSSLQAASASRPVPSSSGTVQFNDLDVHMGLGYAFVTDSAGRIHRIKLPVISESAAAFRVGSSPAGLHFPADAASNGGRYGEETAHSSHSDDELEPTASSRSKVSNATESARRPKANRNDAVGSDASENRIVVDANKSGRSLSDDVTHEGIENESQHPVISGVLNEHTGSSPGDSNASGGFQTAAGQRAQRFSSPVENSEHDDAKPRIVWSRSKSARWLNSGVIGIGSYPAKQREGQQQQLVDGRGALPARGMTQMVGTEQTSFGRRSEARASASQQSEPVDQPDNEIQSERLRSDRESAEVSGKHARRHLATQIAVDWLNNLIFVLDKYRLLVMELDGSNELTLIDDFNSNNRPVDIKVDPINSFLFWLQVGKFHNTIYKLDLDILSMQSAKQSGLITTLKLRSTAPSSGRNSDDGSGYDVRELASLMSHHDAQPIITNLPRNTRMFTIDYGSSKIYVPISSSFKSDSSEPDKNDDTESMHNEAEVFASTDDITHLNSTQTNSSSTNIYCHQNDIEPNEAQLLAYNLDGTDVGLLRAFEDKSSSINKIGDIRDLSIKSESGPLLLLMNDGRELYEEIKNQSSTIHSLGGTSYLKMILVENNNANQPTIKKPRFNVRRQVMDLLSSYRPTRSGLDHSNLGLIGHKDDGVSASRGAPYMILFITCLVVITIYLIYALIFQRIQARQRSQTGDHGGNESLNGAGSSIDSDFHASDNLNGIVHSSTMSRWVAGPSPRNTEASTFDRDINSFNERIGAYDIESNYDASNAIDEHYRGSQLRSIDEQMSHAPTSRLANLSEWPSNMHDLSNKLYVPVEVLQDEALSSIRRVTIEQLDIEHWKAPLGEGHFGTVLQGTIDCSKYRIDSSQRVVIPCKAPISPDSLAPPSRSRMFVASTSSSGHGSSSSASCEFTTANTCTEFTSHDDYLTPRNQSSSAASDYVVELPSNSSQDGYNDAHEATCFRTTAASLVGNRLKVAIKKLKDHASPEEKRDFLQEAKLLANFNHPNIVQLVGICLDRGSTLIVMELMLGGDLTRYMRENTPRTTENQADELSYDDLLKICLDIANGCCYLEDMDYIHRDLAARNCLVSSRKREERVVKLADFGLARDIYKSSYYMMSKDKAMPMKWMAPECLTEQKFTKKSDVWSFGVVIWEVMSYCQEKPYVDVEPFFMKDHLATGARLKKPIACDDSMYKLMNQCWQIEPEQRPTFHECRAMLIEIRSSGQL